MTDLQQVLAAFIDPIKVRLVRDGERTGEWQTLPSIWDQLTGSTQTGAGQGGSARYGSRPVISAPVVALVMAVTSAARTGAIVLTGAARGSVPDNLRAVAANLPAADVARWVDDLQAWTAEARSRLQLDPQRPRAVRGVCCPACGAATAQIRAEGETVRTPALLITWVGPEGDDYHEDSAWLVRAVECRACGRSWWRGGEMDVLIGQMLAANATRETLSEI